MEVGHVIEDSLGSGWEPEQNFFTMIHVDITHRCNMNCANCYIPNRTIPDMNKAELFNLVSRLPKRVVLRLIGGEPTLREDLPEIIEKLLGYGHVIHLVTNGLKIANPEYLKSLKEAGLRFVYISMNGADENEIYKKMDSGNFAELKTKALENVLASRLMLSTGTIVARGVNENSVKRQIGLIIRTVKKVTPERKFSRTRMPEIRFRNVGPVGRYLKSPALSFEELADLVHRAAKEYGDFKPIREDADGGVLDTEVGPLLLRYTDWKAEENFLANQNSGRGRVTKNFKLYYAAEDVKRNENGY